MSDVIKLLEADHKVVSGLFADLPTTSDQPGLVTKICDELTLHMKVEEEIVYPAMKEAGLQDEVDHSFDEHQGVKDVISRLKSNPTAPWVRPLLATLKSEVEHHVNEEETTTFPKFRGAVDQAELDELGARVQQAKQNSQP